MPDVSRVVPRGIRAFFAFVGAALLIGEVIAVEPLPRARPEAVGLSSQRLDYIEQLYTREVNEGRMAGLVTLIARHGKVAHFSAIGYADVAKKQKLQTDAIFRIFSMTKPIAATALMMLYEEGRFQLSDPLSKYIPEFARLRVLRAPDSPLDDTVALDRQPTIHDALRHTVGFSRNGGKENALEAFQMKLDIMSPDLSLAELMSRLASVPLLHQPGTKWVYSLSPDIQARLVEVLSGMSFDEFLRKRLFGTLGMTDSGYWVPAKSLERLAAAHWDKNGRIRPMDDAHGYPQGGESWFLQERFINRYHLEPKRKGGNSGLVSSTEDYWRFAQMLLNGGELNGTRILSPRVVELMRRDHLGSIEVLTEDGRPSGIGFGLGMAVVKDPPATGVMSSEGSFYWGGAGATHFWVDPKEELAVVAMTQHLSVPGFMSFPGQLRALVYSALLD